MDVQWTARLQRPPLFVSTRHGALLGGHLPGEVPPACRVQNGPVEEYRELRLGRGVEVCEEGDNWRGDLQLNGLCGLKKNEPWAFELWSEAEELGSNRALFLLGAAYYHGDKVEQDEAKGIHFWESAAMQGDAVSRFCLGHVEVD
ncbi:hypothetical protein THAOC_35288 [Thalassiosira oceanica]|uniref:Uncharacterized protein n=1 Tax=Thalassiosira oceanica TaxID=159749 RepID=K0RHG0_THAOC|nr:hypothetical protein THAOC_35288 [Thalassiosira oceanica]|eukprot:EJK46067.1 hypothetical protein THAOC_35288 [Thalassiosira oceanica]